MRFSVQQIKFDFLYAIKEFDSDGSQWSVVVSDQPPAETLTALGHPPNAFVYIGKPAGTQRAAEVVTAFFKQRFSVADAGIIAQGGTAEWVILYRSRQSLPSEADLLVPDKLA